jgi:hypothetical protein
MENYPQDNIPTVSMLDFIRLHLHDLNEIELHQLKDSIAKCLKEIEDKKPYYREKIPEYLQKYTFAIKDSANYRWYDDVWYHAAKDGMMGKQIYSPKQIPADATHIVEIHK